MTECPTGCQCLLPLASMTSHRQSDEAHRITDLKVSCDCQQHECGKARARNDQRSVDNDQEAGSDYAHCDKGKYKSTSRRRHRHRSDSSSSDSSSSSEWDCATSEKQQRQLPGCRQSGLRHRPCLPGPDSSERHRHRPAHRSASPSLSRSRPEMSSSRISTTEKPDLTPSSPNLRLVPNTTSGQGMPRPLISSLL